MATCPQCGGVISGAPASALCSECLKRVALGEGPECAERGQTDSVNELLPESAQGKQKGAPGIRALDLDKGERWGEYELLEPIGQGAMGTVFKARHVRLNRVVALKVISQGNHASEAQRKRFRREAEAAARLQHPNVVTLYE